MKSRCVGGHVKSKDMAETIEKLKIKEEDVKQTVKTKEKKKVKWIILLVILNGTLAMKKVSMSMEIRLINCLTLCVNCLEMCMNKSNV